LQIKPLNPQDTVVRHIGDHWREKGIHFVLLGWK